MSVRADGPSLGRVLPATPSLPPAPCFPWGTEHQGELTALQEGTQAWLCRPPASPRVLQTRPPSTGQALPSHVQPRPGVRGLVGGASSGSLPPEPHCLLATGGHICPRDSLTPALGPSAGAGAAPGLLRAEVLHRWPATVAACPWVGLGGHGWGHGCRCSSIRPLACSPPLLAADPGEAPPLLVRIVAQAPRQGFQGLGCVCAPRP